MKKTNLLFILLLFYSNINAQITGRVFDSETGKSLPGAHVLLYQQESGRVIARDISNRLGDFTIDEEISGRMLLITTYVGYETARIELVSRDSYSGLNIYLNPSAIPVGEVVISSLKQDKFLKDVAMPVSVINTDYINKSPGISVSDLMSNEPGLSLARDGIWATSINIRGLSEQRIVTLIDGNRVETATDIAAGMAMVDVNDIERIEVIKGAASSLYGTGALGGVVNIITRDGHFSEELYAKAQAGFNYQTVNSMHSEHASVTAGHKTWYIRVSGTMRDAQNTLTPGGELQNSQFSDNNISLKSGFKPAKNHELRLNYQRYRAEDVGIPGGRPFPGPATATYPEERRDLLSLNYKWDLERDFIKDVSIKYYRQYIQRDVELIPNPNITITPSGYHTTNGFLAQTSLVPFEGHNLIAGIDIWQRNLRTERYKDILQQQTDSLGNVVATTDIFRAETPIPETDFTSGGVFFRDEFRLFSEKLKIKFGGRVDLINVQNEQAVDPEYIIINDIRMDNPANQRITFEANNVNNHSWSANLGLLYSFFPNTDLSVSFSRAFRSPSIEERFKYIDLGSTVNIGDPDLEPENGYFADLGIRIWKERFHFSASGFINSMSNLIVSEPGEIEYSYTGDPDRVDTIPALINANVDRALLYGYDMSFSYNFIRSIVLYGSSSFVRGIDLNNDNDLPLIPPLNGKLGLRYLSRTGYGIETEVNMVADQNKIAEGETATKGYSVYSVRAFTKSIDLGFSFLKISGGIQNLTNRGYVNHLSTNRGFVKFEPGRNYYIRMGLNF